MGSLAFVCRYPLVHSYSQAFYSKISLEVYEAFPFPGSRLVFLTPISRASEPIVVAPK